MTLKAIVIQLRSRGHEVRYSIRADGGIRITSLDGKAYRLSEGNREARRLAGTTLSGKAIQQRQFAMGRRPKGISKKLSKQWKETKAKAKEAGVSEKELKAFQHDYQVEQQQYKEARRQGKTPAQALKQIKRIGNKRSKKTRTEQHRDFVRAITEAKLKGAGKYEYLETLLTGTNSRELCFEPSLWETVKNHLDALGKRVALWDDQAKGILYDWNTAVKQNDRDGRETAKQEARVLVENIRKATASWTGKGQPGGVSPDALKTLSEFLIVHHKSRVYTAIVKALRKGLLTADEVTTWANTAAGFTFTGKDKDNAVRFAKYRERIVNTL